jgi:hypothetical protein
MSPADPWTLRGLLFCGCGQAMHAIEPVDRARGYRSVCGCRLALVDAAMIERLVYDAAEQAAPALLAGAPPDRHAALLRRVFAQVTVGGTADDLIFTPLT